jgi:hypothetical protein
VLGKIFGPKREEVTTTEQKKIYVELCDIFVLLLSLTGQMKEDVKAENIACIGKRNFMET